MRLADECHHDVAVGSLVEEDFGVARGDDLAAGLGRHRRQHVVHLPLAENLQVGVRLIQEQHRPGIGCHVSEQEEHLLLPPAAGGKIKIDFAAAELHRQLAALGDMHGIGQRDAKEIVHMALDCRPWGFIPDLESLPAKISEHLSGPAFPDSNGDRPLREDRLIGGEA